jgi:hypothetical protein
MTNDPKDRHMLAAAVAADSYLIVTRDLDGYPPAACLLCALTTAGVPRFVDAIRGER